MSIKKVLCRIKETEEVTELSKTPVVVLASLVLTSYWQCPDLVLPATLAPTFPHNDVLSWWQGHCCRCCCCCCCWLMMVTFVCEGVRLKNFVLNNNWCPLPFHLFIKRWKLFLISICCCYFWCCCCFCCFFFGCSWS